MTRFTGFLAASIAAFSLSAETGVPEFQNERQPGLLRVSGVGDSDKVLLDGELIGDGKRISRFGNRLFVDPGSYLVTILTSDNRLACHTRVAVRENATAVARCPQEGESGEREVD